jgi:hypothetical protein
VLVAFVPRTRRPEQVALLGAAVMVAMQLSMTYWFSAYLLWFAPLAFAGLFALYDCRDRAWGGAEARAPRARRRVEPIRA